MGNGLSFKLLHPLYSIDILKYGVSTGELL